MIKVENVSMRFRMANDKIVSLKEYVIAVLKNQLKYQDFWVFKDISFEVKKGEVVGIIGKNGAGKSTLLKIIAGVLTPTEGKVSLRGNVVPMLELGSGFDAELSGRENIFLNGSILGYSKEFLEEKYEEILEFSELQKFIDMPIRNYSSGMLMRLAFSIATIVKPEILIVDEILAVGDEAFQKKSKRKMLELMSGGTTVLFVSHSIEQIREMCSRVVWLENGSVNMIGDAKKVCDAYQEFMNPGLNIERQREERRRNTDAEKYYMDILFVYGDIGEDYEWRVHNQKEQLLAGNMPSAEIYYQDISDSLMAKYRVFFFIGCALTEEISAYIEKLNGLHKTVLFDCRDITEWRTNSKFRSLKNKIDGIVAATEEVAAEADKEGFEVFLNKDVCSDRVEQLSEWAVYDRDILPGMDVNQMSGDMEVVNYYRAVQKKAKKNKEKIKISCLSADAKTAKKLLDTDFVDRQKIELYLNSNLKSFGFEQGHTNHIKYLDSLPWEQIPGMYADMDIILAVRKNGEERRVYQEKLYAGLSKTAFFVWNTIEKQEMENDCEIYAETADEFYEEMLIRYREKEQVQKTVEKFFQWVKQNGTALYTGRCFTAWIRKKEKSQIVFLLKNSMKEEQKKNIFLCAERCYKENMDVMLLWEEKIEDELSFSTQLSKAEIYIYGSFDKVVATSWEGCEYLQSYPNMKERFFLQQNENLEGYSAGDYSRFRMQQIYEPCVEITCLVKKKFTEQYPELLNGKQMTVKYLPQRVEEWCNEILQ